MGTIGNELAWTVLLPMAVAAAAMGLANRLSLRPRAAWTLGVGLAYAIGQIALVSRGTGLTAAFIKLARPQEARDWLPPAVLLAMGISLLTAAAPRSWQRWIVGLAAVVCVGVPMRLLANIAAGWSIGEKLGQMTLSAAALAVMWLLLATAKGDVQPRLRAILLMVVAAGTAVTLALAGSAMLGQLSGVVAAALAGATIAALASSRQTGLSGAAGVLAMSLGGLILLGHHLASLPAASAVLLTVAICAAGGRLPAQLTAGPTRWQAAIRTLLCLTPLALALGFALARRP